MLTNIDFINEELDKNMVDFDLLKYFLVGRNKYPGSSKHAGQFSDANIWDYKLSNPDMIEWTSCNQR